MNRSDFRLLGLLVVAWAMVFSVPQVQAQMRGVDLTIAPEQIGLGGLGVIRPGTWAPLRLIIDNQASQPRKVICEVAAPDADGDQVLARRVVTLSPQRNTVWLYVMPVSIRRALGFPEAGGKLAVDWRVRVIEVPDRTTDVNSEAGRLLASQRVVEVTMADPRTTVIGVIGRSSLGLRVFEAPEMWTQHEMIQVLRGMEAQNLPDRWYGLSMLQTLIWTGEVAGSDPGLPQLSNDAREAVRQWVRRGGHLIVILPRQNGAELWQKSPLANMLPAVTATPLAGIAAPVWLRGLRTDAAPIDAYALDQVSTPPADDPSEGGPGAVSNLLYSDEGRPLVVARQYGLGRVTLVGVDLTDPRIVRQDLPNATYQEPNPVGQRFWATLFLWRQPMFSNEAITAMTTGEAQQLGRRENRAQIYLDTFIPGLIAMRGKAPPALLAAIMVFGFYWLIAGPVSFATLKGLERQRKSWLIFLAVVLAFSGITWAGAWLVRESQARIEHFSYVDIDSRSGLMHGHSWLSVFVPTHGRVEVALGRPALIEGEANNETTGDTISSPGLEQAADAAGFVNPQTYPVNAGDPSRVSVPMRSTAKQLELDYLGRPDADSPWSSIQAMELPRIDNGALRGKLIHHLPGNLSDVKVLCCPGDGQEPFVWTVGNWDSGKTLDLSKTLASDLLLFPREVLRDRDGRYEWNEFMRRLESEVAPQDRMSLGIAGNKAPLLTMLSLYSTLPPPRYWVIGFATGRDTNMNYFRTLGHGLDLTRFLHLRRIIIIGNLDYEQGADSPLPLPLTVDGKTLPSRGVTVVRWVGDLE